MRSLRQGGLVVAVAMLAACGDAGTTAAPDAPDAGSEADAVSDVGGKADADDEGDTTIDAAPDIAADTEPEIEAPDAAADTTALPEVTPPTNPLGETLTFSLETFSVAAGTERQVCKTINLPTDLGPMDVVRLRSVMSGTSHHLNVYKVVDDKAFVPVTPGEAKVHDCQPADEQLSGDAAYIFGSATKERIFDTPEGVAFHLEPGQRIILEQHVLNYTLEPAEGGATLELVLAEDPATIDHHADVLWFANWNFMLMPGMETSDTTHCTVPYAVEVFGLMSHFHERGTRFDIAKWTPDGTTPIYEDDDWAHPKYQTYDPPLTLAKGEGLEWTCTWYVPEGSPVVFPGKNATDEMCITFAAFYPKDSLSGAPIQCNKSF